METPFPGTINQIKKTIKENIHEGKKTVKIIAKFNSTVEYPETAGENEFGI